MAGLLGDIYSYGDTLKRKVNGLLADPRGTLEQFVGQIGDQANQTSDLMNQAGWMPIAKTNATKEQQAMARALLAEQGSQMGMAGTINVSMKPNSTWLSAQSENGMVGGHVKDGALHISHANLDESARGMGEGSSLYKALIDKAHKDGLKVFSDSTVELPAVRVYESLGRNGYDVRRLPGGLLDDGSAYGSGASNPAFEIFPQTRQ